MDLSLEDRVSCYLLSGPDALIVCQTITPAWLGTAQSTIIMHYTVLNCFLLNSLTKGGTGQNILIT